MPAVGWARMSSRKLGTLPPTSVPPEIGSGGDCAAAVEATTALIAVAARTVTSFMSSLPQRPDAVERNRPNRESDANRARSLDRELLVVGQHGLASLLERDLG